MLRRRPRLEKNWGSRDLVGKRSNIEKYLGDKDLQVKYKGEKDWGHLKKIVPPICMC